MGALTAGNGATTGGVPFVAGTLVGRHNPGADGNKGATFIAQTLTAASAKTTDRAGSKGGGPVNVVTSEMGVRQLTPLEYERCQGLPDYWTAIGVQDGQEIKLSDSARYRAVGDGAAVPVLEWIGRRILRGVV